MPIELWLWRSRCARTASSGFMCIRNMNHRGSYAPIGSRLTVGAVFLVDSAEVRSVPRVAAEIDRAVRRFDQERAPQRLVRVPDPPPRRVHGLHKAHLRILDRDRIVPVQFLGWNSCLLQEFANAPATQDSWRRHALSIDQGVKRSEIQMIVVIVADHD